MVDEIKLQRERARGEKARLLLENELIQETFRKIERAVMEEWKATVAGETEVRERLYWMMWAQENYIQVFTTVLNTGKIARHELLKLEERRNAT